MVLEPAFGNGELFIGAVAPDTPVQIDECRLPALPQSLQDDFFRRLRLVAGDQGLEVVQLHRVRIAQTRRVVPPDGPEAGEVRRGGGLFKQIAVDAGLELVELRRPGDAVLAKLRHERRHRFHVTEPVVGAEEL